jgi:hypothetical protein
MYSDKRFLLVVALIAGAAVCTYLKADAASDAVGQKLQAKLKTVNSQAACSDAISTFKEEVTKASKEVLPNIFTYVFGASTGNLDKTLKGVNAATKKPYLNGLTPADKANLSLILDKFADANLQVNFTKKKTATATGSLRGAGGWKLN